MKQHLLLGIVYGFIGQVLSFLQLQGSIKYGLNYKYPWLVVLASVPISWIFLKSVENFIIAFDGALYPSRILGFSIGIIVFAIMGWILFGEVINLKTIVCLILCFIVLLIQVLWK